jgi:hypothetical protein
MCSTRRAGQLSWRPSSGTARSAAGTSWLRTVRSSHVHVIVEAETRPERIMNEFKAYASRELNRLGSDGRGRKRWARHGSTRWLWKDEDVRNALRYVIDEQGEQMALFVAEEL